MDGPSVSSVVVVSQCACSNVVDSITIQIADTRDRVSQTVSLIENGCESSSGVTDLLFSLDSPVGVEEKNMDGSVIGSAVVVKLRTDGDIKYSITVNVTDAGYGKTKLISIVKRRHEPPRDRADLLLILDCTVSIHEQDIDRTPVRAAIIVTQCAHYHVDNTVPVKIADAGDRPAKSIVGIQCAREPARDITDFLLVNDCSI